MLCALGHSSLRPRGDLRVVFSRLNGDEAGRNGRQMLRVRRNDRESVSLCGMSETTRTIGPTMTGIGAIDTEAFLFATSFFGIRERTMRFTGV